MPKTRFTKRDLEELYKHAPKSMGGFSAADTRGELVTRALMKQAGREDVQAHELEKLGVTEAGLKERLGTTETGLKERLGIKHEFEKPLRGAQAGYYGAGAGKLGAETAATAYDLARKKGFAKEERTLVEQDIRRGVLDIKEREKAVGKKKTEPEAATIHEVLEREKGGATGSFAAAARPKRALRPSIKKGFLSSKVLPPMGQSIEELLGIGEWAGRLTKRGYEYAYPRGR